MTTDQILPFLLDNSSVRGRAVRLGSVLDTILGRHDYPEPVAAMLGEAALVGTALAAGLKFDGRFVLQTKTDGPISMIVTDITSNGELRAYAEYDPAELEEAAASLSPRDRSVPHLLGTGYVAFTVDQGPGTEPYQGIVELTGASLADCIHNYFRQSEQIDTGLKLAIEHNDAAGWQGMAIALQRLPQEPGDATPEEAEEAWRRAIILLGSATTAEMTDPSLATETLLYRLFHEERPVGYEPRPISVGCRCTDERIEAMLASFGPSELEGLEDDDGTISVSCQFCNKLWRFDPGTLAPIKPM